MSDYFIYKSNITEDYIRQYADIEGERRISEVDWYYISRYIQLSGDFIRQYADKIDWRQASIWQRALILDADLALELKDYIDWWSFSAFGLGKYNGFTTEVARKLKDYLYWEKLDVSGKNEDFLHEFADKIDFRCPFLIRNLLTKDLIRQYKDTYINWSIIRRIYGRI
jgi:hypothetical protein